jgi:hypothetical protein
MESKELIGLMEQVEAKKIPWDQVEGKIKVPRDLLTLYARSGPTPVTILNALKKVVEEAGK